MTASVSPAEQPVRSRPVARPVDGVARAARNRAALFLLTAFAALAAGVILAGPALACIPSQILHVDPGQGEAGSEVKITGGGWMSSFQQEPDAEVYWGGPAGTLIASVQPASDGSWAIHETVPADAEPGVHLVHARQEDPETGEVMHAASTTFEVIDAETAETQDVGGEDAETAQSDAGSSEEAESGEAAEETVAADGGQSTEPDDTTTQTQTGGGADAETAQENDDAGTSGTTTAAATTEADGGSGTTTDAQQDDASGDVASTAPRTEVGTIWTLWKGPNIAADDTALADGTVLQGHHAAPLQGLGGPALAVIVVMAMLGARALRIRLPDPTL